MAHIHYHCKRERRNIVRGCWTKARMKTSRVVSKFCVSMSGITALLRSPTSFSFVDWNMLFFLGLVPLLVGSFTCQVSHDSGSSNILGSSITSKFCLYNFTQWLFTQGHPCLVPVPSGFLSHRRTFHNPFLYP